MNRRFVIPLVILLGLAGLIGLQRLHTWQEPLERDLTLYAVIGHELLSGRALYSDLCENKPPAVFITYAAAEWLAGYGPASIYLLGMVAAVLTLLGVYRAGYCLSGSRGTGLWAASFWTAICSDLSTQANQPNTEVFVNACVIWAFALMVQRNSGRSWGWRYLAIGALLAAASLYKPVVIGVAAALGVVHLAFPPGDPPDRRSAFRQVGLVAAVGVGAWAFLFIYFLAVGHVKDFYEIVFNFNRYASGDIPKNLAEGVYKLYGFTTYLVPYVYFVCVWAVWATPKALRRQWLLLLGLVVGTQIEVALPGRFFPHYYQYWLPVVPVTLAWAIEEMGRLKDDHGLLLKSVAGVVVLFLLVSLEMPNFAIPPSEWARQKSGEIFLETKKMGKEIRRTLKPGENFYQWGAEGGLYYYSRLSPPSGVIFHFHLCHWPYGEIMSRRVVADLEKAKPELFLMREDRLPNIILPNPVLAWFAARYRPFSSRHGFILFVRRGGQLEKRLERTGGPWREEDLAVVRGNEVLQRLKRLSLPSASSPSQVP